MDRISVRERAAENRFRRPSPGSCRQRNVFLETVTTGMAEQNKKGSTNMRRKIRAAAFVVAALLAPQAHAGLFSFSFYGGGVNGQVNLTYGPDTVAGDPAGAYAITDVTGTFSDSNIGISNATITGGVSLNQAAPEAANVLAPKSFSFYLVASGVQTPTSLAPGLSYDNLFYPAGSPQTAFDYPPHGGFLDIYGMVFTITDNLAVNFWSDGDDGTGLTYGAAVTDGTNLLDYVFSGVSVPEPGSLGLLGTGLLGMLAWRRRSGAGGGPVSPAISAERQPTATT
jgi:hypothetical protein